MVFDKQLLLHFLLLIFLLVFLVLGNSFLIYYLILIFLVLGLIFKDDLQWSKIGQYRNYFWLWIAFFGTLLISSLYTHSLPLTIEYWSVYIFYFLFFTFLVLLKDGLLNKKLVLMSLLSISFLLSILSIGFKLFPSAALLLPGMNILYATYGHNHLSAFLLLVLPLSFNVSELVPTTFFKKYGKMERILHLSPLFIMIMIILCFGRAALGIALLQVFVHWLFVKQNFANSGSKTLMIKLMFVGGVIWLFGLLFISNISTIAPQFKCDYFFSFNTKICKPLITEVRPLYWEQAYTTITKYPIYGYGPGTFALASKKFTSQSYYSSAHAHNDWLELIAENGVLNSVVFIILIGGLFLNVLKQLFIVKGKKISNLDRSIGIALGGICINSFVDFDFQFRGIFISILLLLVLVIRDHRDTVKTAYKDFKLEKIIYTFSYYLLLIVVIGYGVIDSLIIFNKTSLAFKIFPYYLPHMKIFAFSNELNSSELFRLVTLYQNHNNIYTPVMANTQNKFTIGEKAFVYQKMLETDPWQRLTTSPIIYLVANNQWEEAKKEAISFSNFFTSAEASLGYQIDYSWRQKVAREVLILANHFYEVGDYKTLVEVIKIGMQIEVWSWSSHKSNFLTSNIDQQQRADFLLAMSDIPTMYYGIYGYDYALAYLDLLVSQEWTTMSPKLLKKMIELDEYTAIELWNTSSTSYLEKIKQDSQIFDHTRDLEKWYGVWLQLNNRPDLNDSGYVNSLKEALMMQSQKTELSMADQQLWSLRASNVRNWLDQNN